MITLLVLLHFIPLIESYSFNYPNFCPWPHLGSIGGGINPLNSVIVNNGDKLRMTQAGAAHDGEQNALFFADQSDFDGKVFPTMSETWSSVWTLAADKPKDGKGASGYAFIIASISDDFSLGGTGSNMGYGGLDEVIAIEFDFIQDASANDPDGNHISVHSSGPFPNLASPVESAPRGIICTSLDENFNTTMPWIAGDEYIPELSGRIYGVNVTWVPQSTYFGTITVQIESGENERFTSPPLITCSVDLREAMGSLSGQPPNSVYLGFTVANYDSGDKDDGTGNISIHAWLLDTSTNAGQCFPQFDNETQPPCQPIVPATLTCDSLTDCISCTGSGRLCSCTYCGTQNVCADKSDLPSPCAPKVTKYDSCPAPPSASPSSSVSPSSTSTSSRSSTSTGTHTASASKTATSSPSVSSAPAGNSQNTAQPLSPGASAGIAITVIGVAGVAAFFALGGNSQVFLKGMRALSSSTPSSSSNTSFYSHASASTNAAHVKKLEGALKSGGETTSLLSR